MIRTPSPLWGTPPIAPFHFATEGELAATLGKTEGELADAPLASHYTINRKL